MKKLIPLSDYVLQQVQEREKMEITQDDLLNSILNYTKFLRQPLTLGMFVPVDDEGNVLREPGGFYHEFKRMYPWQSDWDKYKREYREAKEKVLFDGFSKTNEQIEIAKYICNVSSQSTVEDLVKYGLPITPSALKLIGVKE